MTTITTSLSRGPGRPLAHRLLFPNLPNDAEPPSLVGSPELDAELYDFIALALRAYVTPWWSKISKYDKQLLPEVTQIIAAVIRQIDSRLRSTQLAPLLLREIPAIITQHYRDYRNAVQKLNTSYASGGVASLPQLFHYMQPHMAISSDGRPDTEYFRQIIDHILKVCLPLEDYTPEAERFIVREVVLKVLLNDVIPKITQPWFIEKVILDLLRTGDTSGRSAKSSYSGRPARSPSPTSSNSFSVHASLVLILSVIQSVSGAGLALANAYRSVKNTIIRVQKIPPAPTKIPAVPANYAHSLLIMCNEIFTIQGRLAASIIFDVIFVFADLFLSFLDRLLPYLLSRFLSAAFILDMFRLSKHTLFPDGYPGPPPIEPTIEEQAEVHAHLAAWKPQGISGLIFPMIMGSTSSDALEDALEPLSNAACNTHLVLFLFDCVILSLFPELGVREAAGRDGEEILFPRSE